MRTNEQTPLSQPTSAVRNTLGKEQAPQNLAQQEKLKAVKARLKFEEASQYSESETPNRRRNLKERLGPRDTRTGSEGSEQRRGRSKSSREKGPERRTVFKRLEKGVFHRLGDREKNVPAHSRGSERKSYYSSRRDTKSCYQSSRSKETEIASEKHRHKREYSRRTEAVSESEGSAGGHWKSKPKKQKSSMEDDLSQPWESIPGKLPPTEKCIKDPVEIYNIKQRNEESKEEFMRREVGHTTDECMHLKRKIEEMLKAGKLSHLIKELKQNHGKDQAKIAKKRETSRKDKPLAILMVQPWQKIARKRITQTFSLESVISFPTLGKEDGTEGPMIIEAEMGGHCVHRIYVDEGSSSEILYEHCFNKFHPEIKNQLIPVNTPLVGFSGEIIWPLGQISLLVRIGNEEHSTSARMNFMVVRSPSPYNGIIGRPRSSRIILLECSMVSEPGIPWSAINQVREEKLQVAIHPEHPEQTVTIGSTLTEEGRKELCGLLRCHLDVFAWKPADMTRVPRHIAEHRLNVRERCLPVRQKKRRQAPKRNKAISEEVKNWRMCVDFKDLNKACPKDGYPLPKIDWKVESLCGYPYKCVLDAYKGYHQIKMAEEDEKKTTFITSQGIFCYSKMPFGLKNAGATYQRLVNKAFQKQIGRNLKLNPKKCAFGMREGTFLGYKVDADGLRVSSDKVKAVLDLPSPKCLKDAQKLNGKLASLNIFFVEKSLPFFKTLKTCTKKSDFQWTLEAKWAFKEMKQLIAEISMLTAPKEKEELIMYLAAEKEAISTVLMTEMDGKQVSVYFISRALQGTEINYTPMEKLILALVSARRLLKWRFELGEHDTQYRPRTSVKGQILADFIVEHPEDGAPNTPMEDREELPDPWILFTDGSSCVDGSGAEYEALIAGLRIASQMGIQNLQANMDSKLVANQKADALSKTTSTSFAHLSKQVLVEELREKAIDEKEILAAVEEEGYTWMTPVYEYLTEGILPEEKRKQGLFVVAKALRSGYFWTTMYTDARNLIRECKDCQVYRPVPRNPQEKLTPITSPWPFYKWGIDIAGPFPEGPGKVEEVSHVLWAHRTMIKSSNEETPFSLTYGAEAVIRAEIGMPTLRTAEVDMVKNNEALGISLDLLEEKREQVAIQEARNKAKMEVYYNAKVQSTSFRLGDFVYWNNEASHAKDGGKLRLKWEGPYEVTEALGKGAYRLRDRNGHTLPRTWNICNLKKCYMHEM
uniref:Reverse transcriptase domain-containing protein n=1 Tax=Tanacetum cinerariifolium TaxID=118510 RepID=A0A6L2MRK2_TANCI|nr:hypothetical protein [Tanacetum cinerariifolium]